MCETRAEPELQSQSLKRKPKNDLSQRLKECKLFTW